MKLALQLLALLLLVLGAAGLRSDVPVMASHLLQSDDRRLEHEAEATGSEEAIDTETAEAGAEKEGGEEAEEEEQEEEHARRWYEPAYAEYRMDDNDPWQYLVMMLVVLGPIGLVVTCLYRQGDHSPIGHAFRKCLM